MKQLFFVDVQVFFAYVVDLVQHFCSQQIFAVKLCRILFKHMFDGVNNNQTILFVVFSPITCCPAVSSLCLGLPQ